MTDASNQPAIQNGQYRIVVLRPEGPAVSHERFASEDAAEDFIMRNCAVFGLDEGMSWYVEPEDNGIRIGEMQPGTHGWTVPWALHRGAWFGRLMSRYWLNTNFRIYHERAGTACMLVDRSLDGLYSILEGGDPETKTTPNQYHSYYLYGRSVPTRFAA